MMQNLNTQRTSNLKVERKICSRLNWLQMRKHLRLTYRFQSYSFYINDDSNVLGFLVGKLIP